MGNFIFGFLAGCLLVGVIALYPTAAKEKATGAVSAVSSAVVSAAPSIASAANSAIMAPHGESAPSAPAKK